MNIKKFVGTFIITLVLAISASFGAFATTTLSSVTYADSKITVSGTCTSSNQAQIVVFDSNNEPIYLTTVEVVNDKFSKTLDAKFDLENGTYTVKTSNYNGTEVDTTSLVVNNGVTGSDKKTDPVSTKDNNMSALFVFAGFTVIGIIGTAFCHKTLKANKSLS